MSRSDQRDRQGWDGGGARGGASPRPEPGAGSAGRGSDSGLWWETAAERLDATFPMRHADATAESVSAAARARGIPSTDVRWPPGRTGTNRKGCKKSDLAAAVRP